MTTKPRNGEKPQLKRKANPRYSKNKSFTNRRINNSIVNAPNVKRRPRNSENYVQKRRPNPRTSTVNRYARKVKTRYGKSPNPLSKRNRKTTALPQKQYKTPGAKYLGNFASKGRTRPSPGASFQGLLKFSGKRKGPGPGSSYSGKLAIKRKSGPSKASSYTGTMPVINRRNYDKERADYSGFLTYRGRPKPGPGQSFSGNRSISKSTKYDKQRYDYRGNLSLKRTSKNLLGALAYYLSTVRFGFPDKNDDYKKVSRKIYAYSGDTKIRRSSRKAHPSARYKGTLARQSYLPRDKVRKFNIWFTRLFSNQDQPPDVRKPIKKPKYDSREYEIWND
ncbi:MAG: hypothetical protein AAF363_11970 [Bacteroidota bacterium]